MDDVLDLGRKANVKEAVDKVYGVLGLLPVGLSKRISPDYNLTPHDVYCQFATVILQAFPNLDALFSWCSYSPGLGLPSWVPNWSTQYGRNHLYWLKQCSASGSKVAHWNVPNTFKSLHCRGFVFDTIQGMSGSLSETDSSTWLGLPSDFEPSPDLTLSQYKTVADLAAALRRTLVQNLTYPDDELYARTTLDICWVPAGLLRDQTGHLDTITSKIKDVMSSPCWIPFQRFRDANADFPIFGFSFRDFFPAINFPGHGSDAPHESGSVDNHFKMPRINTDVPKELDGNDALVMKRTTLALQGRRLITTTSGFLGTAPEAVLKGDILTILYGCSYPVVLRPSCDSFLLIGESYIDGVMDGELVETREGGKFEETDFKLC